MQRVCSHGVPIRKQDECLDCDLINTHWALDWHERAAKRHREELARIESAIRERNSKKGSNDGR